MNDEESGTIETQNYGEAVRTQVVEVRQRGLPEWIVIPLLAFSAVMVGLGYELGAAHARPNSACVLQNDVTKAQAETSRAQVEYQAAQLKVEQGYRMGVLKACVERGDVPIFSGGNIDCKAPPARK